MKTITLFFIVLAINILNVQAQNIITVAGGGTGGDGGPATAAGIEDPTWIAFDKHGNYYIAEGLGNKIRKINTLGIITTFAGTGTIAYNGDGGLADTSNMSVGSAVFDTSGDNLYIPDGSNYRLRKINMVTNIVTTAAGNGASGFSGDGNNATAATLQPNDVCFDKFGNTFIIDIGNYRIRKIAPSGIISSYAGTGTSGWNADSGAATAVELGLPRGIATDDFGNLYIADEGSMDNCIWKVSTTGIITTFAGNHTIYSYNGDNIPATTAAISPVRVACHSGDVYIADFYNDRIRMVDPTGIIHTVAGNGINGHTGDNGPADSAELNGPSGIAFDTCGNLYITEVNGGHIRKVIFDSTCGNNNNTTNAVQNIKSGGFSVYPNPANLTLTLSINGEGTTAGEGINSIALYNMFGEVVYDKAFVQQKKITIDISSLPNGVYFVKVNPASGGTYVEKVLKE